MTHTYRNLIYALTHNRPNSQRYTVTGYHENGAITTAFDMRVLNEIDRCHIVKDILDATTPNQPLASAMDEMLKQHRAYILDNGIDPDWVNNF